MDGGANGTGPTAAGSGRVACDGVCRRRTRLPFLRGSFGFFRGFGVLVPSEHRSAAFHAWVTGRLSDG